MKINSIGRLKTLAMLSIIYGFLRASIEVDKKTIADTANIVAEDKEDIVNEMHINIKETLADDIREYLDALELTPKQVKSMQSYISILKDYLKIFEKESRIYLDYVIFSIPLLLKTYDTTSYNVLNDIVSIERLEPLIESYNISLSDKVEQRKLTLNLINYYYNKIGRGLI